MVKLKKLGIIFIMFFVIIIMSACNDKDDPLYINAMSFFFDNNGGTVEIKNKKQDVYFENPDETFYAGVSFRILKKKKGEDTARVYNYYYNEGNFISLCFKKDEFKKILTTKSNYEYTIYCIEPYGGVYLNTDFKEYTDYDKIDKSLLPENFGAVHTYGDIEKIEIEKGESIGVFCAFGAPYYDTKAIFNGEVGFKSLNPNITINTISNINPYSNNEILKGTTYINITYNDDEELNLSDIAFEQVPIE